MKSWKLYIYLGLGNLLVLMAKAATESSSKELSSKKEIDYDFVNYSTDIPNTTDDFTEVSEEVTGKDIDHDFVNYSTETRNKTDGFTTVSEVVSQEDIDYESTNVPIFSTTTGELAAVSEDVSEKEIDYDSTTDDIPFSTDYVTEVSEGLPPDNEHSESPKTTDTEMEKHNVLIYSAYIVGWFFAVLLVFMAAASLFCLLTGVSGMFYWVYIGCRKIVRKCCCSKEDESEYYSSSLGGNWILREAATMKPI